MHFQLQKEKVIVAEIKLFFCFVFISASHIFLAVMWFVKHSIVLCSESCFVLTPVPSQQNVKEFQFCNVTSMRKSILFHGQVGIMMAVYTFIIVIVVIAHVQQLAELNLFTKFNILTVGFLQIQVFRDIMLQIMASSVFIFVVKHFPCAALPWKYGCTTLLQNNVNCLHICDVPSQKGHLIFQPDQVQHVLYYCIRCTQVLVNLLQN